MQEKKQIGNKEKIRRMQQKMSYINREKRELKRESKKKDKMINLLIDHIMTHQQFKTIKRMCCSTCKIEKTCVHTGIHRDCIIRYFEKKVEEL